jgi:hypothetical protein
MTTQRVYKRGSLSAKTLERAWICLREIIPGLPPAVVLPMDADGRHHKCGHFAPSTWRVRGPRHAHEVAISPLLFTSPNALLATMVHEAVHALLYATVNSDVHVGGVSLCDRYYHRREFRDACRRVGLDCRYLNGRYGWTLTDWPEGRVPEQYRHVVRILEKLPLGGGGGVVRGVDGRPTPISGQVRLRCGCDPVRTIHVGRRQVERGGIVCALCQSEFRVSAPQVASHVAA